MELVQTSKPLKKYLHCNRTKLSFSFIWFKLDQRTSCLSAPWSRGGFRPANLVLIKLFIPRVQTKGGQS